MMVRKLVTVAVQLCTVIDRAISVTLGRGMAPCPRSSSALLACHRLVQDALLNPEHYLIRSGSELGHLVRLRSGQLTAGWPKVERQKLPTPPPHPAMAKRSAAQLSLRG